MLGLGIGEMVINMLGIPGVIILRTPGASLFNSLGIGAGGWLMAIIVGVIICFQLIKLFFEIGERYVVLCVLILLAPLGLSMGGSKATHDIAKGYIRMYASMVVMMILNVVFLKLVLSVLSSMPNNATIIPWCILIVALVRVARKADNMIARIGLNPMVTGDPLGGRGGATALVLLAARAAVRGAASKAGSAKAGGGGSAPRASSMNTSKGMGKPNYSTTNNSSSANNQSGSQSLNNNQSLQSSSSVDGQSQRFGSQQPRSSVNNTASKNSQTANSTASSGASVNSNSSNAAANSKFSQGGNSFDTKQSGAKAPTQINTNRFGNNNAVNKNTSSASMNNNATEMSALKLGQTNNMTNMQKSAQSNNISAQQNLSAPKGISNLAVSQNSIVNQDTGRIQGKNAPASAKHDISAQTTVNNGKNNVAGASVSQPKSAQAVVNQGKNIPVPVSQGKNVQNHANISGRNPQTPVNNGKNTPVPAGQGKNAQTSVLQGKNATVPANTGNKPQATVPHGKKPFTQTTSPIKMQHPAVKEGKNVGKPVDIKAEKLPPAPEIQEVVKDNEVTNDG
jgi:hypothetical protein